MNGEVFARFGQAFDNFVVPAKGTANSGTFGNVLLTQGALASLPIIPLGYLDIGAAQTVQINSGGYELPWMQIKQDHVPTTYSLSLSLSEMKSKLSSISASKAGHTATSSLSSDVSSAAANVTSKVSSVLSQASQAVSSGASDFTSRAGAVVSAITSEAGGLLHPTASPSITSLSVTVNQAQPSAQKESKETADTTPPASASP